MDNSYTTVTKNARETQKFGQTLAASLMGERAKEKNHPLVVCLFGELGSGKTTFVQGFAKGLGVSTRLLSPTFIIVRRYSLLDKKTFFYHVDLYRIKDTANLDGLGLREIFSDPVSVICIEWPKRLGSLLPKSRTDITFNIVDEEERKITIQSNPKFEYRNSKQIRNLNS